MALDRVEAALEKTVGYINGIDRAAAGQAPDEPPRDYPCPDTVWIGPLNDIAAALGHASWEVWMGAMTALGAIAQRHVHAKYYGPLFGQFYGLLIKPTGTGKSLCTDTFRALLPDWYSVSGAVQSGPALMPIVATITREEDGTVSGCTANPTALIIPEWTRLAKNLKIQHSTLLEDMNEIADGRAWNISRSEANKNGGNMVVQDPVLTICATTTENLFKEEVTTRMIRSGFVNRYLILPGSFTRWLLYDPTAADIDFPSLTPIRDRMLSPLHFIGQGAVVWDSFSADALERFLAWGKPLFEERIMNSTEQETEIYKRLHTYALRLCLLYAWSERASAISLAHVEAVIAIIETSHQYLEKLMGDAEPYVMPSVRFDIEGKEKVAQKIRKESGKVDQMKLAQDLRKSMRSKDIARWVQELIQEKYVKKVDKRWLVWGPF